MALENQAQSATSKLLGIDTNALYIELGKRVQEIRRDPSASGRFDMTTQSASEAMGAEQLQEFGRRFFNRANRAAYALMCSADSENSAERENLTKAFGLGMDAVAPALTGLLVVHLGMAPAIAAVIAVLAVKLFFQPGYDAMCEVWKKSVP
jgi:hypothetical protein